MTIQKIHVRNAVLLLMIAAATAFRFLSFAHPYVLSNFTPVAAIALFGGAVFADKWKAFTVPLFILWFSDIFLNRLYTGLWRLPDTSSLTVYLSFMVIAGIGCRIKRLSVGNILLAAVGSVLVHWLITDLPFGTLYPHSISGYLQSLAAAIPFEKNMLLGTLLFSGVLFGGFQLAQSRYPVLRQTAS